MIQRALDYLVLIPTAIALQVAVTFLKRMNRYEAASMGWPKAKTRPKAA